jgi:hypothetical protein
MEKDGQFEDFDDEAVYRQSQVRALDETTRNFVVEFGKGSAHIAFNLGTGDVQKLFESERHEEKPIRWMLVVVLSPGARLLTNPSSQQHLGSESTS